ncbi:hypothetical protein GCM10025777_55370 [Membranihabitans marinus]
MIYQSTVAQSTNRQYNKDYRYYAKKAKEPIIIDGELDELDWKRADEAKDFAKVLPIDTGWASQSSEVMVSYSDQHLYIAITFYDTLPGKRVMESFRRDFSFGKNDNFLLFLDPFLDQTTGFSFGVSASGAQWDGTMSDGSKVNTDWDCKWVSVTKHYKDRWVSEMSIPFKSISYPSGSKEWNINFSRLDLKSNEKSSWAPVPRQFPTASLSYTGRLVFEDELPPSKVQLSFIPYINGSYSKSPDQNSKGKYDADFGMDAKIGLSSSMNIDLTYNPDFAQVEVDQQITNIDRFELLFPEKRQFFLQNSDLFSGYGEASTTPFFTRRIGLDAPVLGGVRLSGKLGNDVRVGLMNMTTQKTEEDLARNYTVASIQKKVFARSNIGVIFVNKEYFNQPDSSELYNRVLGLDYNLASKNNTWTGKFYYHNSFQAKTDNHRYSQGARLAYKTKNIQAELSQISVGKNYDAEVGYIQRRGYHLLRPTITYLFVPNKKIVNHGPTLSHELYFNPEFQRNEQNNTINYLLVFRDRSELSLGYKQSFIELDRDFDPTYRSDFILPQGSTYSFGRFLASYTSTAKKLLSWSAEISKGDFYNGTIQYVQGQLGYRIQPYVNMSFNVNYTDISLPYPFIPTDLWLIGPKLDITLTEKIFWSLFVQYNEQIDNLNLNMRFQWRYQPVSDIFLVYTDNYAIDGRESRSRALVFKMTYWIN